MHNWVDDFTSLVEFFSMVIVCAPDNFFKEDYLTDDQQLTLDSAFAELRHGVQYAEPRIADKAVVAQIYEGLDSALAAYHAGQQLEGARQVLEVEKLVLAHARRRRRSAS
jgi:hypothetical protein